MSLLMDALKKAEQAKRQAESASRPAAEGKLELEGAPPGRAGTPDQPSTLPELPTKMELLDEQFATVGGARASGARAQSQVQPGKEAEPGQQARDRKAAQQVFAAKHASSQRPFHIGLGILTLGAVAAIAGYFWWQLQPKSSLVAPPPGTAAAGARPQAAVPTPLERPTVAQSPPSASGATGPAAATPPAQPGEPAVFAGGKSRLADAASAGASKPVRPPGPTPTTRGRLPQTLPAADAPDTPIRISSSRLQIDQDVARGYQYFLSGNVAAARAEYEHALQNDPRNTDALNGLAAISLGHGRADAAEAYYLRVLEADPRDATAQAGLIGLRGNSDPLQAESRLRTLVALQPDAHAAHFALGNVYAWQGRWHEAQQAYFRAYTGDPDNPDYQFNLAVSLDQLHQPRLALQYYQGALAAAAARPAAFDKTQAASRARELQQ